MMNTDNTNIPTDGPYPGVTWEEYEIARVIARWILAGMPNRDRPETRQWLLDNGYGDYLDMTKYPIQPRIKESRMTRFHQWYDTLPSRTRLYIGLGFILITNILVVLNVYLVWAVLWLMGCLIVSRMHYFKTSTKEVGGSVNTKAGENA